MKPTTIVIGAGVIGTTIALELQRRARRVLLVDRGDIGMGASFGNMASIAVAEFMPATGRGVLAGLGRMLLDARAPIRIRPSYLPRLLPWAMRYLAASRPARQPALEAAMIALSGRSLADTQALLADLGAQAELSAKGCLSLYASEAAFRRDAHHLDLIKNFNFDHEVIEKPELHELEPELSPAIEKAVLMPDNRSLRDPHAYVTLIGEAFLGRGGEHLRAEVRAVSREGDLNAVQLADGSRLEAREVVIAAGAHSGRIARTFGEAVPLESDRGYHTQIMAPGVTLNHSLIWHEPAFMITPTAGGIRVGGTVELAGLDAPPDFRRARSVAERARKAVPGLELAQCSQWMGHRPALPDSVPLISPSARLQGVFHATGHGHSGLTQAATTARLMAQMVLGEAPDIDMSPYRVERFGR